MKFLLFVGLLLVILIMLSGNVQEGALNKNQIKEDKAKFDALKTKASNYSPDKRMRDLTLSFSEQNYLADLIRKFKSSDPHKNITRDLTVDEAKRRVEKF